MHRATSKHRRAARRRREAIAFAARYEWVDLPCHIDPGMWAFWSAPTTITAPSTADIQQAMNRLYERLFQPPAPTAP